MEPSGRSPWQPVANETAPKTARTGGNRCGGLRPDADLSAWPLVAIGATSIAAGTMAQRIVDKSWSRRKSAGHETRPHERDATQILTALLA